MNKNHWYDGKFYDLLIAPHQDKVFNILKSFIVDNARILDVGCGTGRLSLILKDKIQYYDGIDLSIRNIRKAKANLYQSEAKNIWFHHTDVNTFFKNNPKEYDYAIFSYIIHEVDESTRRNLLVTVSSNVNKIIIIDYRYPRPKSLDSIFDEIIEALAGREHYRNFRHFILNKGITGIAERTNLKIVREIVQSSTNNQIVLLTK